MKSYLYPLTYKRKVVLWYFRVLRGRSRDKTVPAIERELCISFIQNLKSENKEMYHYVHGVFAKELIVDETTYKIKFTLVDNETKIIYHKYGKNMSVYIEKHVSAKTAAHMNKLFDKEFIHMLVCKNENYNKIIKDLFSEN